MKRAWMGVNYGWEKTTKEWRALKEMKQMK